jgi:drug/metabolite transporter (DMT)-like permease
VLRAFSLQGPVSMVLPASAMYPLVTALLAAAFLKERLNRIQAAGFVLALIAVVSSAWLHPAPRFRVARRAFM